jgi:hypothetical protein
MYSIVPLLFTAAHYTVTTASVDYTAGKFQPHAQCHDDYFASFFQGSRYHCTGCESTCGLLTSQNGTLFYGPGGLNFSSKATCTWIIAPPGALAISIRFTELSTQLNKDFVRVFQCSDVACSQQQLLANLSGVYVNPVGMVTFTGYMKVVFESDSSNNNHWFSASWITMCKVSETLSRRCMLNILLIEFETLFFCDRKVCLTQAVDPPVGYL